MDLQYFGANCVAISYQGIRILVDDNLVDLGAKSAIKSGDVAIFTGVHATTTIDTKLTVDSPGEYEVGPFSVIGVPARAHIDEEGKLSSTMYLIEAVDIKILITGHIYPELTDEQLEAIGMPDVLIIPVGGNGFTLDPVGALDIIKAIEPKIVIPTHYADNLLKYPIPQISLADALKGLAMEPAETTGKLKLRPSELTESLRLFVLEKN
jgi:L-ascorbate metabolism protein UlaG (beta-lactamase superfamily)